MKTTTRLGIVLGISITFFAAEIAVGFKTKSLALIADAFHYLNDIVAYAIAFVAAYLQANGRHTINFTYAFNRAELVGAFFNGVFLLALGLSICLQSIERFIHLESVEQPMLVLIIGCVGLALNVISALFVHDHHGHSHEAVEDHISDIDLASVHDHHSVHEQHHHQLSPSPAAIQHSHANLGMMGVLIHLLGDAVNNIGVIISAVLIWKLDSPHRFYVDPATSLAIGIIIFAGAIPLSKKCGRILLEAAPSHLDLEKVKSDLLSVPDVLSVHDLHVWHLSQSVILASLHVCVPLGTSLSDWAKTEQCLQHCFSAYGVKHVTISPELSDVPGGSDNASEVSLYGSCRVPADCKTKEGFGCDVGMVRKRVANRV